MTSSLQHNIMPFGQTRPLAEPVKPRFQNNNASNLNFVCKRSEVHNRRTRNCDLLFSKGGANLQEEWVVKLTSFLQGGPVGCQYHNFADSDFYVPAFSKRKVVIHPWTKTNQLLPTSFTKGTSQWFV